MGRIRNQIKLRPGIQCFVTGKSQGGSIRRKRGSGTKNAKHPSGRSGFWYLTPFSSPTLKPGCDKPLVEHRRIIGYRDHIDVDGFPGRKLENVLAGAEIEGLQAGQTLLAVVGYQRPAP